MSITKIMLMQCKVRGTLNKNILIMQIQIFFQFYIIVKNITNPIIIIITVMEMKKTLLIYNSLQN
jgi:hypothetical protein